MNNSSRVFLTGSIGVLALAVAVATSSSPMSSTTVTEVAPVAGSTQESGAVPEGIKVHGHWVIEVRDPDGTLAERRKFENALTGSGSGFLSQVLAAQGTIGLMRIVLHSTPCLISGQGGPCSITEGGDTDAQGYFSNLVKNFDGENVVLSGSATAGWDGQIDFVNTALLLCPDVIAPKDCDFSAVTTGGPFTGTELATPIPVAPGQQIQVTVTISFG